MIAGVLVGSVGFEGLGPMVTSAAAAAAETAVVGRGLASEKAHCTKIKCYFYRCDQ